MAGGKGGSTTSSVEIPEYIEAAAQRNLSKAERISQLGYVPYYGPDVAALTPMQQAAMQNVAGAASAFGMATPTGQDVYGMPAPTTFAGGIQGYSSAPMFEQAQAEFARQRPAQKSYIDSFFIDPYTGQYAYQPFDYTTINTMAEDRRQREAADRATQLAVEGIRGSALTNAEMIRATSAVSNAIGRPYNPATDVLTPAERKAVAADPAASRAQDTIAMNILGDANLSAVDRLRTTPAAEAVGAGISFANPASTGSYGGSLVTGRPSDSSQDIFAIANAGSANMTTAREDDFVSDLTRSLTDPNYDPPGNVITRALGITPTSDNDNDGSDDSGGGGDGTVMCTAYCEMGYLPKEIWHLDRRYGVKVYRNDPALIEGYHTWGVPLANYIRKQTLGAKVLRAVMWPIVKAWAEEMAHNMKPEEYKPNYFGKLIKFVGEPFSRMCGKLKPRKVEELA